MITLYLDGTQVYPDVSQNIKLTDQNPYFKLAGSYTLDVTFPMDILANREFFRNINRMEISKTAQSMKCVLMADNSVVMDGLAHITEVTENSVKVQLEGGNSEINFLSEDGGAYIDKIDYGGITGKLTVVNFEGEGIPEIHGATHEGLMAYRLLDIIESVLNNCGFTLDENFLDREPWNQLYVTPKSMSSDLRLSLPHWTASEFLMQVRWLFNVTFKTDVVKKTVSIVSNMSFIDNGTLTKLEPIDEYKVEMIKEDEAPEVDSIANASLYYSLSSSEFHDVDCLTDETRELLRQNGRITRYAHLVDVYNYINNNPVSGKRWLCVGPSGHYAVWKWEPRFKDEDPPESLTYIDCFAPLERDDAGEDNRHEIKIVPVAMKCIGVDLPSAASWYHFHLPSVTGRASTEEIDQITGTGTEQTLQKIVEDGLEDKEEDNENEDIIEIMFMMPDDTQFEYLRWDFFNGQQSSKYYSVGFTDGKLKLASWPTPVIRRWSLSLNPTDADHYIGELHNNPYTLNVKARHVFQILSDKAIDPTDVFIIRGKRYMCEKIETNIKDGVFDKVKTGYFYEILS